MTLIFQKKLIWNIKFFNMSLFVKQVTLWTTPKLPSLSFIVGWKSLVAALSLVYPKIVGWTSCCANPIKCQMI
jgi:hypothetical protein